MDDLGQMLAILSHEEGASIIKAFKRLSQKSMFRHCELRGTKQEANQNIDFQWIASSFALAMTA